MTYIKDVFGRDMQLFDKYFVGFDEQINRMAKLHDEVTKNIPNYPPYNIRKVDDNKYVIEMAVAGFSRSEIEVEFVDDKLVVRGNAKEDPATDYLFRGIAARNFTRTFALNDQIEIKGAGLMNGMLQIALERIIPEHKKPKKIEVADEPSTVTVFSKGNAQLLTEEDHEQIKKARSKKL
jgi:molecular chaperone IbpA